MPERWWLREHGVTFTWDLWYACNYRCSYCWWEMEDLWEALARRHKVLPPQEWLVVWDRIHARYGELRLDILGGEPLLYPCFAELLACLCGKNRVVVTTNLSWPAARLEAMLERLDPGRAHFHASFHPQFTSLEDFLARLAVLKDRGYDPAVLFVTWPPFVERLPVYREAFRSRGIPFSPMIFQGRWQGRAYPEAFTEAEKALIETVMDHPTLKAQEVRYRLNRDQTLGKLCHSGRVYANVKGNGDVYRCGQDAFGRSPLGNIFDPGFGLHDAPQPCPYARCSCLEFKYLDEVYAA